jgi:hypothetical protein
MISDCLKLLNRLEDTSLVNNGIGKYLLVLLLCTNKLILEKVVHCTELIKWVCFILIQPQFKTLRYLKVEKNNLSIR